MHTQTVTADVRKALAAVSRPRDVLTPAGLADSHETFNAAVRALRHHGTDELILAREEIERSAATMRDVFEAFCIDAAIEDRA